MSEHNFLKNIFTSKKDTQSYDIDMKSPMQKLAGINISSPDQKKIEGSIISKIFKDLDEVDNSSVRGKRTSVRVQWTDIDFATNKENKSNKIVTNGKGNAIVKISGEDLFIPFSFSRGIVSDFSVIEKGKNNAVVYSPQNLAKLVKGIEKIKKKGTDGVKIEERQFKGLDKPNTTMTSDGFMAGVLNLKKGLSAQGRSSFGNMRTASESNLDGIMEKIATCEPYSDVEYKEFQKTLEKIAKIEEKTQMEKTASVLERKTDNSGNESFQILTSKNYKNIVDFPNNTFFAFPERRDGSVVYTKAVIIKDMFDLGIRKNEVNISEPSAAVSNYNSSLRDAKKRNEIMVISERNEVVMLNSGDTFLGYEIPRDSGFNVKQIALKSLKEKNIFLFPPKVNQTFSFPFALSWREDIDLYREYLEGPKTLKEKNPSSIRAQMITNKDSFNGAVNGKNRYDYQIYICELKDSTLAVISADKYYKFLSKKYNISTNVIGANNNRIEINYPERNSESCVIVSDFNNKVIPILGVIDYPKTMEDIQNVWVSGMSKIASARKLDAGYVKIECIDRAYGKFSVTIRYEDSNKPVFKQMLKDYKGISESKLRETLRALKYSFDDINTAVVRAKNQSFLKIPLPDQKGNENFKKLDDATNTNVSLNKLKTSFGNFIDPTTALLALSAAVSVKAMGSSFKKSTSMLKETANAIKGGLQAKKAESSELCVAFEKYAQEFQREELLDCAKIAKINVGLSDLMTGVVNEEVYKNIDKVASDIVAMEPKLSKIACDLIEVKDSQFEEDYRKIETHHLNAMINDIDFMFKVASFINDNVKEK